MSSDETMEKLGQLSDRADNTLAATKLPLPAHIHLEGMKGTLEAIRDELRAIYVEATGENPWEDA